MKKALLLLIIFNSVSLFAKIQTDTITNWQLYKDKNLLFKSNEIEKGKRIGIIKTNERFKSLNLYFNYCTITNSTFRRIEFIFNDKIIISFSDKKSGRENFEIKGESLISILKKYKNKEIRLKFYDNRISKGIILGKLKIS